VVGEVVVVFSINHLLLKLGFNGNLKSLYSGYKILEGLSTHGLFSFILDGHVFGG